MRERIDSHEALIRHLVDCTLATVDRFAMQKKPLKNEYGRQRSIAQVAINYMVATGISPIGTRAHDVIENHNGQVSEYAAYIENTHREHIS